MSENLVVNIPTGGCSDCTNCGLCAKGEKKTPDVVTFSTNAPEAAATEIKDSVETVVAVDLGTTTVGMYLVNAATGEQMGVFVALNPQQLHGPDVISRISAASGTAREELRTLILETIENGVIKLIKDKKPSKIVISGNTVMGYLLMGYDTAKLGVYPFEVEHQGTFTTEIAGIPTVLMPGISAFVGGDIVSGLYTLGFSEKNDVSLLLDLGTNAEMVIGNAKKRIATSAAAGPAFEQKMYATQLISAAAQMLAEGKMDETGCLADEYFELGCIVGRMLVKQEDIRSLQMAKAAVRTGIELLVEKYGVTLEEIDTFYLAGGLGFYLDLDAAFSIGLFPEELKGKVQVVGNTSLEGAYRYAMDERNAKESLNKALKMLTEETEEFSMAEAEGFDKRYITAMNFT
ncbi:MAG: DUF4445 domain-containing protein [Lachnospiraceae bacterium]|nr:DUF4445 domain-containing protein [Lachnospiraceae bacterium]